MTIYKHAIKIILNFFILIFFLSCKNEKPTPISTVTDTDTTIHTIPKRLFFDSFPPPTGYINDYENVFTVTEKDTLAGIIKQFEKETTIQIAVITFDTVMTTAAGLDALTFKVANAWGVGQKGKDNGVLIGLSKHLKKIRIENGKGISRIFSDAETKQLMDEDFIPLFKQGKYFNGVKTGLLMLMKKLRLKYTA